MSRAASSHTARLGGCQLGLDARQPRHRRDLRHHRQQSRRHHRDVSGTGCGRYAKTAGFRRRQSLVLVVARRGTRLAYTRLQRDVNIYAAELAADGSLKSAGQAISSSSRRDLNAVFSPDGSRIAVSSDREGSTEIWITGQDGRNPVQVTNVGRSGVFDAAELPQWSPDGSQIAFASRVPDGGSFDIFVVNIPWWGD